MRWNNSKMIMSQNVGFIMVKLGHKLGNLTLIDILADLLNTKEGFSIFLKRFYQIVCCTLIRKIVFLPLPECITMEQALKFLGSFSKNSLWRNWLWFWKSIKVIMLISIIGKMLIPMVHLEQNTIHSQLSTQGKIDQSEAATNSILFPPIKQILDI